ncbi:hypothetical protein E8E11_006131 [Didymella keratinophila]|nr:hypothetical protein E8E11_006131 [Didymella keratinophila]
MYCAPRRRLTEFYIVLRKGAIALDFGTAPSLELVAIFICSDIRVSFIRQTKPLDFIAPLRPTKVVKSVPEMTVEAFELYTPSAEASISDLAETAPTKSNSGSTPDVPSTDASTASDSHNAGAKIAGTIIGIVFALLIIPLIFEYWRARRRGKANESAPVDMEAVLEQKCERAQYLEPSSRSPNTKQPTTHRYAITMSSKIPMNAEDRKVGPIPLPVFIPMCIFTPSLLAIMGYFVYLKTARKFKDKK